MEEKQSEQTKGEKIFYAVVDGCFRLWDEMCQWWNIGLLSMQATHLRRKLYEGGQTEEETEKIQRELTDLDGKAEFLRSKSFSFTPHLVFIIIFILFVYGIIYLKTEKSMFRYANTPQAVLNGQITRVRDFPFKGHSVITDAKWFDGKLYVGGDGGLFAVDVQTGVATASVSLPKDFYVRDLYAAGDSLLITGFSGIYRLKNGLCSHALNEKLLPTNLFNAAAEFPKGVIAIGTVGQGLYTYSNGRIEKPKGVEDATVRAFGYQKDEIWLLSEKDILAGNFKSFKPLNLQVLEGRVLTSIVNSGSTVYVGTDQGVVAGSKSSRNQFWTILSAGGTSHVNSLAVSGGVLFIGSNEGVYRYYMGRTDRLSSVPCKALEICGSTLAAVNDNSVMLYEFSAIPGDPSPINLAPVPEMGTYTPVLPIMTQLPQTRLQYGRMPDLGLLESDGKTALVRSKLTTASSSVTIGSKEFKDYSLLPTELQHPIFTDIIKTDDRYLLATENRGIWAYKNGDWQIVEGLSNSGVSKLYQSRNEDVLAYGSSKGVWRIKDNSAEKLEDESSTEGLISIAEKDNKLYMMFKDGLIKIKTSSDPAKVYSSIPKDLSKGLVSMWAPEDNKIVAVTDTGILTCDEEKMLWNLAFFGGSDNTSVVSAAAGRDSTLYIALSDGRIVEYIKGAMKTRFITDKPVSMNFSGLLWVASKENLFFLENNSFVRTPLQPDDVIIGTFPEEKSNSLLIFTGSGVKKINTK